MKYGRQCIFHQHRPETGCRLIETTERPGPRACDLFVRRLAATVPRFETTGLGAARFLEAARFVRGWCAGAGVGAVPLVDAQLLLHHPYLLQVLEHFLRHAVGQVDQAVVVADAEAADVLAFQPRLVGDRADDIARLHAVLVADLDAVGALAFLGGMRAHRAMAELAWRSTVMRRVFAWPLFGGPRFARRVAGRGGFARMRRAPLAAAALAGCRALDPLARGRFVLLAFRRRRQQQRLVALGDARECGGDLDRRHVVFLLVLLDQLLEFAEAALGQRVADALLELADAHVVDHLDRRQLHLLDRLAGGA